MIDQTTSPSSRAIRPSAFTTGPLRIDREVVPGPSPAEEIVAKHTAIKPSRAMSAAYAIESIVTALPLLVIDLLVTSCGLLSAAYLLNLSHGIALNPSIWLQIGALLVLQTLMMSIHQLYPGAGVSPMAELRGIVRSTLFSLISLSAMNYLLGQLPKVEFATFACAAVLISVVLPTARSAARQLLGRTTWWGMRTLLVGSKRDCKRILLRNTIRRSSGFMFVGYVCPRGEFDSDHDQLHLLGATNNALEIASQKRAPVAAIASPEVEATVQRLAYQFPWMVWIGNHTNTDDELSDLVQPYTKSVNVPLLRFMPRFCKRCLDIAICIPLAVILALPMLLIALAIKWSSPGPVFYASRRIGQHGKPFKMWKFRSMVANADEVLEQRLQSDPQARLEWERDSKLKDDPRIIPGIGQLLRRWSLDELPQLWNVITGEMSLVGPRPLLPCEIVRYQNRFYDYTQMWPGVTGLWQVSGRNETTFDTRIFLVHNYATNWSLWLDACILLRTPSVILTRRGAY